MDISKIGLGGLGKEIQGTSVLNENEGGAPSFGNVLEKMITETNDQLKQADEASKNVAIGRSENLHEAMITMEKAETALKFLVQVRNKAMEAYHEVMRMQV